MSNLICVTEPISNYVVFDLETTGLSIESDEIIEISAIRVVDGKMTESFSTLIKPSIHIPISASCVNNITDEMVSSSPNISDGIKLFIEFIKDDILVGHNIDSFDMKFIQREASKIGLTINNKYVDSVLIARDKLSHLASRSLGTLSKYYGVSYEGAHRALQDCGINYKVFEYMMHTDVPSNEKTKRYCKTCGKELKLQLGKYGKFYSCLGYPECNYNEKV